MTDDAVILNIQDIEDTARRSLPPGVLDYFAGGAEDEISLRANRDALESLFLCPRYLVDVSHRNLRTTMLGRPVSFPVLIAPTGFQALAHPEGELAMARAAQAADIPMVLSTFSTHSLEAVRQAATGPRWFQLYVHRDRALTADLVTRAAVAGYEALVLTVDVPVLGRRERDARNGFSLPPDLRLGNFTLPDIATSAGTPGESGLAAFHEGLREPSLSWKDLSWLQSLSPLPILLKGVLRADDARDAVDAGVQGIIVSNHGGRQLDGAVPGIRVLPEIVDAVGDRAEVYVDGGIRRGTDILKALALGARGVLLGRPMVWGLAMDGEVGAGRVLAILRDEFDTAMALCGACTVADITRDLVRYR